MLWRNNLLITNIIQTMGKKFLITASILGLISIVLGAFGAHALKEVISEKSIIIFETGTRYQMYHALMLLYLGETKYLSETDKKKIFRFVIVGIICFSGSIYLLAINELTTFNFKSIGFITPMGGVLLITAWSIMIFKFIKYKPN